MNFSQSLVLVLFGGWLSCSLLLWVVSLIKGAFRAS